MASTKLLPFQQTILQQLTSPGPESDGLLLLARGLGLRTVLCSFLETFADERSLVVVVNATPEEEKGLSEELGMRLSVIGFEMPAKDRQALYARGGIVCVTTRILIIDMLLDRLPVTEMSGIAVLHAENVTPTSMEAFVMRVYREKNKDGFIKAFSDEPESFTFGVAPLQTVLQQLHIRHVFLYPRFHEAIATDLEKQKNDVLNLHQPMSESMEVIQTAIIDCMDLTLNELKKSNTVIEVDDLTVESALFRSFDAVVKKQLDPHWHRVGPKTRQLVNDLSTLRQLLQYLLSFDAVSFNQYLETILTSNTTNLTTGKAVVNQSPWLFLPAADKIFDAARNRVYKRIAVQAEAQPITSSGNMAQVPADRNFRAQTEDAYWGNDDDDSFLNDPDLLAATQASLNTSGTHNRGNDGAPAPQLKNRREPWAYWCPAGSVPILEEQPKWLLLREILEEIEAKIHWEPIDWEAQSNDLILIMCNSVRTVTTLRKYLSSIADLDRDFVDPTRTHSSGRDLLLGRATEYFLWKGSVGKMSQNAKQQASSPAAVVSVPSVQLARDTSTGDGQHQRNNREKDSEEPYESAALKRKNAYRQGQPMNKRRRIRGGGTGFNPNVHRSADTDNRPAGSNAKNFEREASELAESLANETHGLLPNSLQDLEEDFDPVAFDQYFGLCDNEQTVVIRSYSGDEDDRVLEELRPRFVIIYDPDASYIRRIETYRAAHPGSRVGTYFMMYANSAEEQRYLSHIRRERESFERLIKERSTMAIPLQAERRPNEDRADDFLRTVSSRIAGGGKHARVDPPSVIVDVREFRSSLPSLLHAAGFVVVPVTLTIGDYVLSPDMCVERKSLPDLIQSFNSGRLYQQCEVMSTHYKIPILLIEFDQKKSFSLETYSDTRGNSTGNLDTDLHSKIVLLALTFQRLRIIWSSSPYATADIFADLKANRDEPDATHAASVGSDSVRNDKDEAEATVNQTPQEMLRSLPGVNAKNYLLVMEKVKNMEELVSLDLKQLNDILGVEVGRQLHKFINHNLLASKEQNDRKLLIAVADDSDSDAENEQPPL